MAAVVPVADSWPALAERFHDELNVVLTAECLTSWTEFTFPPAARIVDELRQHEEARITRGVPGDTMDLYGPDAEAFADSFRSRPLDEVLREPFALAHFHLSPFDAPGGCLEGFADSVLTPWQERLAEAGFTWERCYPILFISGVGAATNYHVRPHPSLRGSPPASSAAWLLTDRAATSHQMDNSHVRGHPHSSPPARCRHPLTPLYARSRDPRAGCCVANPRSEALLRPT